MTAGHDLRLIAALLIVASICVACVSPAPRSLPTPSPVPSPSATVPTPSLTPTSCPVATTGPSLEPDPAAPYVIGRVPLLDLPGQGRSPQDLAMADDRIYVANSGTGNVSIVDGGRVVMVVPVGSRPVALVAETSRSRVYVLDADKAQVAVLEGDAILDRWSVPVGSSSLDLVEDTLWVGTGDGRLLGIGTDDGLEKAAIALSESAPVLRVLVNPADPAQMAAVTYGRVHLVDRGIGVETAAAEMGIWRTLAYDPAGDGLYVGAYDSAANEHRLLVLAADDLAVQQEVELPGEPRAVLVDADAGRIYVALGSDHVVAVLSTHTLEPLAMLPVGRQPVALALWSGVLHVACAGSDQVARIDAVSGIRLAPIPVSARIPDLGLSEAGVCAALSSSDEIVWLDTEGVSARWRTLPHPAEVAWLAGHDELAVLSSAAGTLALYGSDGTEVARYGTGSDPRVLHLNREHGLLYAGRIVLDLATGMTHTVGVTSPMGSMVWPEGVVHDARRGTTYLVASNGVPGSNQGLVAYRLGPDGFVPGGPGRLSIVDVVYDAGTDRFLGTYQRMGTYGLQVWDPETKAEVLSLPLSRRPTALTVHPATHHLWVGLGQGTSMEPASEGLLRAYDTRTMGLVAELSFASPVTALAVDAESSLVYAACEGEQAVSIIQDVETSAPPAPTSTLTPTPWATLSSSP
jgi:DNA-binding beta-propeller fold protein YncE